ncbi:MAG: LamG domain-containing protein, partial [Proteobacteria bacterium]|nr:LamG domain-containing protein [Pseudomonadota bacterium]
VVDSAVTAGTSCTSLTGTASFDTTTGVLSWTPDVTVWGSFELKVTGTSGSQSSIKYLAIAVRPNYVTTNLIGAWDAQFADSTQSVTGNYLGWKDLSGNSNHGAISNSSNASWSGSGTVASPYALNFNGSGSVDFGTTGSASTKMMFSGWVNPSNTNSGSESVIIGNSGNASGNGFTVRQKPSYRDVVMSLNPVGYWRLGETSGTTAVDLGSGGNNGTIQSGVTLGSTGALTSDLDAAMTFPGSDANGYVTVPNGYTNLLSNNNLNSVSIWVNPSSLGNAPVLVSPSGSNIFFWEIGSNLVYWGSPASYRTYTVSLSTGSWYHIVFVKTGSGDSGNLYINGALQTNYSGVMPSSPSATADLYFGRYSQANWALNGKIDEVAIFNSALTGGQVAALYRAGTTGKKLDFVIGKSYRDIVLADNPVGYWRLGESSGATALDVSTNGIDGAYIGGTTLGSSSPLLGDLDKSVTFNGSSGYINVPDLTPTKMTGNMSIEAWIKTGNAATEQAVIYNGINPGTNGGLNYYLEIYQAKLCFGVTGNVWSQGTATLNSNTWYHIAVTYDLSNVRYYINGVLDRTVATTAVPSWTTNSQFNIGRYYWNNTNFWNGSLDEVALYNVALTDTQILTHYNAGIGTYGGSCTSNSGFSASTINFISGLFDGSTASLYVNGRQECTVSSVPQKLSSASTNLTAGSTSTGTKGWIGYLADLLLYGTSDGSAVATAANVKTNFEATADRYRQTPIGNLVTNGLILNLDAANAKQGLRPFANGCASTDLNWFDLSNSSLDGILSAFTSCGASSGWLGTGIAADPYRLKFDGTDDYVETSASNLLDTLQAGTMVAWIKASGASGSYAAYSTSSTVNSLATWSHNSGQLLFSMKMDAGGNWIQMTSPATSFNDGNWHQVAFKADGTNPVTCQIDGTSCGNLVISRTGGSAGTAADWIADMQDVGTYNHYVNVGAWRRSGGFGEFFNGSIANILLYSRALTASELTQNCLAFKTRVSTVNCN